MKTASVPASLSALLFTIAFGATPVWGVENEDTSDTPPGVQQEVRAYQDAIAEIESSEGAYGGQLSESLLSLAQILQAQGRHAEAIDIFKRGVHLTRVNEGLYCTEQIPLLQGEIASHKAQQNYALADDRQNYLYRVQVQSMGSGDPMAKAFMAQADWQFEAYQLGLEDSESYIRLMNMWDLNRQAMEDVLGRESDTSPKLLPPLQGMLEAQYLMSSHPPPESDLAFAEESRPSESLLQYKSYRAKSFQQGSAVIEAISAIEQERAPQDAIAQAQNMVMLGDWRLWNGKSNAAWEAYRAAETELARTDDAQLQTQALFGAPVALPDIAALNPLPPVVAQERGDILVAFDVSENGRVRDLERMDDNDIENRRASRLMRQLRRTRFRPRFEAGQPVETEKIVKAFELQ